MSVTTAELNYIVPTEERPRSFTFDPCACCIGNKRNSHAA
jgi:DUF1680 family protein